MTVVRSKAPLRLGLAGGGTDVSPYSDEFGGCVLNATIGLYAYCTIETLSNDSVEFVAKDLNLEFRDRVAPKYSLSGPLPLHAAVYNRIVKDFHDGKPLPLRITTYSDAPAGSGLGASSTIVVAIIAAFRELLRLPLGEYELAYLAFEVERIDCGLSGGKQDQYATMFGGFNFMEFYRNDRVVVNPLRIRRHIENELQSRLMLYFTGVSRSSAQIIEDQIKAVQVESARKVSLGAMHEVKKLAVDMKESLLRGEIDRVIDYFRVSWDAKMRMSKKISNPDIEKISSAAFAANARAVKVSGAGGGGFMMIFTDPVNRVEIERAISPFGGYVQKFSFTHVGAESWRV